MANTSTYIDQFTTGPTLGPLWPGSFGGADVNGSRGRIPSAMNGASTGFAGIQSASTVTLDSMFGQFEVAPANGGATGVIVTALVLNNITTSGTQIRIAVNSRTGLIRFESNVAFSDGAATSIAYNATDHAWWRIRISGANILYETAPNGKTWTVRRTLATPAWVNGGAAQAILIETQRASGSANFAYVDNFNVIPVDGTVTLAGTAAQSTAATVTSPSSIALGGTAALDAAAAVTSPSAVALDGTGGTAAASAVTRPAAVALDGTGAIATAAGISHPISTVTATFDGATLPPEFSTSFGNVGVSGGLAFVECGPGFPAIRTADAYTLDQFYVKVFSAVRSGATSEATTGVWIQSPSVPGGTDIGILFDAVNQLVSMRSRTGYFDGGAVDVAHVPGTELWVRLGIVGSDAVWDTSPDGDNWTTVRTSPAPAWVLTATDVRLLFEAHRSDGADNFAQFDNVNVPNTVIHDSDVTAAALAGMSGSAAVTSPAAPGLGGTGAMGAVAEVVRGSAGALPGTAGLTVVATVTRAAAVALDGLAGLGAVGEIAGPPSVPRMTGTVTVRATTGTATVRPGTGGTATVRGITGTATTR